MRPVKTTAALFTLVFALLAQAQEFTWRDQEGNAVPDAPYQKAKDGFGGMLLFTEDEEFFERWNTPEPPKLVTVDGAERGVPIHTVLIFAGARAGTDGHVHVSYDAKVLKPDGSVYGEFKDIPILKDVPPAPPLALQLASGTLGILIEPEDPAGTYTVEIVIRDHVRESELKLTRSFVVPK